MKEGWTVVNYGNGLFIYVYNFYNLNQINNAGYCEKIEDIPAEEYLIGMWKPKTIKENGADKQNN